SFFLKAVKYDSSGSAFIIAFASDSFKTNTSEIFFEYSVIGIDLIDDKDVVVPEARIQIGSHTLSALSSIAEILEEDLFCKKLSEIVLLASSIQDGYPSYSQSDLSISHINETIPVSIFCPIVSVIVQDG